AVRVLRPRLVVLENVAGHLSLGFGRVLGDLAQAGFDAEWGCVRASDVGAAHRRERVFIVARSAADADRDGRQGRLDARPRQPHVARCGAGARGLTLLPTPRARDHKGRDPNLRGVDLNEAVALLPTPRATDGAKGGPNQRGSSGDLMLPSAVMPDRWGQYAPAIRRW